MKNPFDSDLTAEHYVRGRPYFHPLAIGMVRERLGLAEPVPVAVDVGAGTGLSTLALCVLAKRVLAVDPSVAMLRQQPASRAIVRIRSTGENLPLRCSAVDLVLSACSYHWLEQEVFLREAGRVLRVGGWLVLVDHFWQAEMKGSRGFGEWARATHREAFPGPPRRAHGWSVEEAPAGFALISRCSFENETSMNRNELIHYMMSQSNVASAIAEGRCREDEVFRYLKESVEPLFVEAVGADPQARAEFPFGGHIITLRRV